MNDRPRMGRGPDSELPHQLTSWPWKKNQIKSNMINDAFLLCMSLFDKRTAMVMSELVKLVNNTFLSSLIGRWLSRWALSLFNPAALDTHTKVTWGNEVCTVRSVLHHVKGVTNARCIRFQGVRYSDIWHSKNWQIVACMSGKTLEPWREALTQAKCSQRGLSFAQHWCMRAYSTNSLLWSPSCERFMLFIYFLRTWHKVSKVPYSSWAQIEVQILLWKQKKSVARLMLLGKCSLKAIRVCKLT